MTFRAAITCHRDRARPRGITLVELIVAMAVLSLVMLAIFATITTMQNIWTRVKDRSDPYRTTRVALDTIARRLTQATLATRMEQDPTSTAIGAAGNAFIRQSDLHFVLGPVDDLLLRSNTTSGHAVFFQAPFGESGSSSGNPLDYEQLRETLCAWGYFVDFGDDAVERPAFLRDPTMSVSKPRRRFRLMEFRQPAQDLTLFQARPGSDKAEPGLRDATSQDDLYRWFRDPVGSSDTRDRHLSVVAENVVAVLLTPYESKEFAQPGQATLVAPDNIYDSRRFQWFSGGGTVAEETRHRLPRALRLTVIATAEDGWLRMEPAQIEATAARIRNMISSRFHDSKDIGTDLRAVGAELDRLKMPWRVLTTIVRPAEH